MTRPHILSERRPIAAGANALNFEIGQLVEWLASPRWEDRHAAEKGLRELGAAAVPALVDAHSSSPDQVRWGAARVLSNLGWPSAVPALVAALEDPEPGVRWMAAASLAVLGEVAVVPLLRRLVVRSGSPWMRDGAHQVLHGQGNPELKPVMEALEGHFPVFAVPVAAHEALRTLEGVPSRR